MITRIGKSQQSTASFTRARSGKPGWIELPIQPGNQPFNQNTGRNGGRNLYTLFGLSSVNFYPNKQKEKGSQKNEIESLMDDDKQKSAYLIRAAELARQGGNLRPSGPDPATAEQLGIRTNILRRQRKIDIEWVSEKTGYEVAEIILFEAGMLSTPKMLEIFNKVAAALELTIPSDLVRLLRQPPLVS